MKHKVMVTDCYLGTLDVEKKVLNQNGAEMIYGDCRSADEVIEKARNVNGLIIQFADISRKVFEALPEIKVVGRYGVGVETIDVEAATEHGVYVVNVAEYCEDEVSNHALALMMACARKVVQYNKDVKNGLWDYSSRKPVYRLKGQTLGLLGFGKIPRELARKAAPLGLEVLAYDPFVEQKEADKYQVRLVKLDELLKRSDFISSHVPLNAKTRDLISENEFYKMKESAYIINTSRGGIINEDALINALEDKKIAGAALDVVTDEPVARDDRLAKMDNVILTPHAGFYSEESLKELKMKVAQGVVDVLNNKEPQYLVNKDVLNRG